MRYLRVMIHRWKHQREERVLRRNEDRAIAQFREQIAKFKRDFAPAIKRAMTLKNPSEENLLLSQRFEKTSHLSRCILNLQHARILRTAHALDIHVAKDDVEKQYLPLFHLLTKDGKSRVECAIAERKRDRRRVTINVGLTVMGVALALVVAIHGWKR